jgi:hypothetical protein
VVENELEQTLKFAERKNSYLDPNFKETVVLRASLVSKANGKL